MHASIIIRLTKQLRMVYSSGSKPVGRDPMWGRQDLPSIFIGVATGRQTFYIIYAQLHIQNIRSCLCQKLCSVKTDCRIQYVYSNVLYRNITGERM